MDSGSKKIQTLAIAASLLLGGVSRADETAQPLLGTNTPYINPQKDCITEGMTNPEGMDYRYLFSRDCRIVYVLPPAKMKQGIKAEGMNLSLCKDLESRQGEINEIENAIREGRARQRAYETALEESDSKTQEEKIRRKLDALIVRLDGYTERRSKTIEEKKRDFDRIAGARFSIDMDGNVKQNDLNLIRATNHANLNRIVNETETTTDANGNKTQISRETIRQSSLRFAPIDFSVFSFTYINPNKDLPQGGIISSSVPGLEYLEQNSGQANTIHVRANGALTARLDMALEIVCPHTEPNAQKQLELKKIDPFFSVNRTFEIQQMFGQGYTARLKVDKFVEQLSKHVSVATEHNFSKSSVFEPILRGEIEELVEFQWDTDYAHQGNLDLEQIMEIKAAVGARLIDNYVEDLLKQGIIEIDKREHLAPAQGGTIDVTRSATECHDVRRGGIGGLFGGKKTVCNNYTYVVKEWRDGYTYEDVKRQFTLSGERVDRMQIHQMAPIRYTTMFSN